MKIEFWGIFVDAGRKEEILEKAFGRGRCVIFTPNAVMANRARRDEGFRRTLLGADVCLPDGAGLVLAARVMGLPLRERVPGIEFGEAVLERLAKERGRAYFLGGAPGVAARAAAVMERKYPGLTVCGARDGYFADDEGDVICEEIRRAAPQFLAVCLGSPRQEEWVMRHRGAIGGVPIIMALGGSLDVWCGDIRRAPEAWQRMGLEWLWRMIRQPRRFKDAFCILALMAASVRKRMLSEGRAFGDDRR